MSVKMVSGMMGGVAQALNDTSQKLASYETDVERVRAVSGSLQAQMKALLELAGRVDGVLGLIENVALQTRMLAFNATLESARAGDQGRGFAVVAGAVKDLARQTRDATQDIRAAMEHITRAANDAGTRSLDLDASLESIRKATDAFVVQLKEQAEVSQAACRYVDAAADTVDAIAQNLSQCPPRTQHTEHPNRSHTCR
jgi:methyl-accepting chemotaxis protein